MSVMKNSTCWFGNWKTSLQCTYKFVWLA